MARQGDHSARRRDSQQRPPDVACVACAVAPAYLIVSESVMVASWAMFQQDCAGVPDAFGIVCSADLPVHIDGGSSPCRFLVIRRIPDSIKGCRPLSGRGSPANGPGIIRHWRSTSRPQAPAEGLLVGRGARVGSSALRKRLCPKTASRLAFARGLALPALPLVRCLCGGAELLPVTGHVGLRHVYQDLLGHRPRRQPEHTHHDEELDYFGRVRRRFVVLWHHSRASLFLGAPSTEVLLALRRRLGYYCALRRWPASTVVRGTTHDPYFVRCPHIRAAVAHATACGAASHRARISNG